MTHFQRRFEYSRSHCTVPSETCSRPYTSTNSNFDTRNPFLVCALLQSVHRYRIFTRFVGLSPPGTFENLPRLPIPRRRFFCRVIHVREDARPFRTFSTSRVVCFLHAGHIDRIFLGIFNFITDYDSYLAFSEGPCVSLWQQRCLAFA